MRQAPSLRRTRRGLFRWFGCISYAHHARWSVPAIIQYALHHAPHERGRFGLRLFAHKRRLPAWLEREPASRTQVMRRFTRKNGPLFESGPQARCLRDRRVCRWETCYRIIRQLVCSRNWTKVLRRGHRGDHCRWCAGRCGRVFGALIGVAVGISAARAIR